MREYKELTSLTELQEVIAASSDCAVLILKHSTRCPISARAHQAYEAFVREGGAGPVPCFLVKVIENRELSRWIAEHLDVEHHSPQAILIRDGKPVWVSTHYSITKDSLQTACAEEQ
jgi:bacillithiol system protein YtxJ